jgi:23S rRNA (cytidine1920-2'-O)/16S rRNA (cytidine1409-2'-O)-methyltransferase
VRRRLDAELVRRGLATSRTQARDYVEAGRVLVGGAPSTKPARQVDAAEAVVLVGEPPRFVGRGGEKLAGALTSFDLSTAGLRVLDAGASTGGFTDCALQGGAVEVVALDVGHGQLHDRLRRDPRVVVMERTNLRHVDPGELGPFDAVVSDLSFISLTKVMSVLVGCCAPGGWLVLLVKPQFEAGRREVSRGRGVITDPEEWRGALERVVASAEACGADVAGLAVSPLRGAEGNVEFLAHLRRRPGAAAVAEGPARHETSDEVGERAVVSAAAQALIDATVRTVTPPDGAVDATEPDRPGTVPDGRVPDARVPDGSGTARDALAARGPG